MTRYYLSYQPTSGDPAHFTSFESMSARVIWILDHVASVVVLSTWEANEGEPSHAA